MFPLNNLATLGYCHRHVTAYGMQSAQVCSEEMGTVNGLFAIHPTPLVVLTHPLKASELRRYS